jgi:hypothetical protein
MNHDELIARRWLWRNSRSDRDSTRVATRPKNRTAEDNGATMARVPEDVGYSLRFLDDGYYRG